MNNGSEFQPADVSIIIVNWNTKEYVYKAIQSIYEISKGFFFEVIVVDNASYDGCEELLKNAFPAVKYIQNRNNDGFSKANNLGTKHSTGKNILFLNPDTKLTTNAIKGMNDFLDQHTTYDAVGCRLIDENGKTQYIAARAFPTPFKQFCELAMVNRLLPKSKLFSTIEKGFWDHENNAEIDCISGACMMIRRETVEKLNGFDENLFMYAEDVDLCYRIGKLNRKIYYLADEKIIHYEGQGSKKQNKRSFSAVLQRKSNCYFLRKHFGERKAQQYRIAVLGGAAIRLAVLSIFFCFKLFKGNSGDLKFTFYKYFDVLKWSITLK